jgi:hypothetical protein
VWRSLYVICFSLVAFPIASVRAQDCDLDGIPDATEIANCPAGDLSCADCNNNGVPDGCDLNSQLGYTSATTLSTSSTRPVSLVVVDVNGANGPDLVVGTLDSPDLEIWLNNGSGTMTAGGLVAMGDGPFEIVAADFDGVGGMDLASVNMLDATGSVTVALNNGSGAFTLSTSLALGTGASGLVAAELDGSTGIDLAVVHEDDQLVTVLLNNGDGTFTVEVPPSPLATSDGPLRVAAYANNETGRMDLAVTNHDNNSLSLFRNNLPVGSFQTGTIRALPGAGPYGIVGTEIDSLNGGDLVITNELTNNVVVLLDSFVPGVFSSRGPFAVGSAPRSVVVADLNTDGSVDLATANFNSNTVSVLLGDGSGGFNPSSSSPATGSGPHYVVAADFDGDGLRDLATANRDGNSLSVFFATLASPTSVDCQLNDVPDECEMDCDNPPFAFCANTLRSTQGGCTVDVDPEEVDTSSFDPDGTQVILALDPPGPYPVGTTPVQLIVEDTCCQLDTCSAAVIITDGDAPSINCPSTQNVGTNFACTYIGQIGSATASDNCSLSQDILISNDSGGAFPQGMTVVTWTAVDEAGNSASCTQQILVFDDDDPFITCPSDRFLGTNLGCGYLGGVGSPTVSDNCSFPQDIDVSSDADAFMPVGLNMVTWTATDEAGNVDICTQRVTVVDDDPPSLVCPPALSVQTNVGCTYVGSLGTPTVQDNCSTEENITVTNNAPAALPLGIIQVTWTATDEAGNSETCIQQVSVSDGSPPAVTCPSDVTLQTNVGCTYVGSVGTATATDNCTPSSQINVFNTAPSAYPVGTTIVSWVAMDATGNTSVCLQNVTIEDDDAPVISCPQDLTVETNFT